MTTLLRNFYQEYYEEIGLPKDTADFANTLVDSIRWKTNSVGRQEATLGRDYTFSKVTHKAQPIPEILLPLLNFFNKELDKNFNVIHCNIYLNGNVGLGGHTDNEPEHKSDDIISLSFGASRVFTLGTERLVLNDGDLVIFNRHIKHSIPKQPSITEPRLSLTFREFH